MSTAIALLSGKGGSGKTTLALSMADLMSKCKIKTLLIDCDLCTNGATYFFESNLAGNTTEDEISILSFYDYLRITDGTHAVHPTRINTYFDFLPSISSISANPNRQSLAGISMHIDELHSKLKSLITTAEDIYDVILFDCQAGYTELLSGLLPLMDADIFVLEADSISASAMRNLHLKTGNYLGQAKLYQVFNKASKEEYETYSKIVGTFFTNIGTLLFDWKIRQAFSRSQIPELGKVSAKYGADLFDICKVVLTDAVIHRKLESFSSYLKYRQAEEEKRAIEEKLDELIQSPYSPRKKYPYFFYTSALLSVLLFVISISHIVSRYNLDNSDNRLVFMLITVAMCIFTIFSITVFFGNIREDRNLRHLYERRIKELDERIKDLKDEANNTHINDENG